MNTMVASLKQDLLSAQTTEIRALAVPSSSPSNALIESQRMEIEMLSQRLERAENALREATAFFSGNRLQNIESRLAVTESVTGRMQLVESRINAIERYRNELQPDVVRLSEEQRSLNAMYEMLRTAMLNAETATRTGQNEALESRLEDFMSAVASMLASSLTDSSRTEVTRELEDTVRLRNRIENELLPRLEGTESRLSLMIRESESRIMQDVNAIMPRLRAGLRELDMAILRQASQVPELQWDYSADQVPPPAAVYAERPAIAAPARPAIAAPARPAIVAPAVAAYAEAARPGREIVRRNSMQDLVPLESPLGDVEPPSRVAILGQFNVGKDTGNFTPISIAAGETKKLDANRDYKILKNGQHCTVWSNAGPFIVKNSNGLSIYVEKGVRYRMTEAAEKISTGYKLRVNCHRPAEFGRDLLTSIRRIDPSKRDKRNIKEEAAADSDESL